MIGVVVTFNAAEKFDPAVIAQIADEASSMFKGMPGLGYKFFTMDADQRRARNIYVWESEEKARAFFSPALVERVTGLYGVTPDVEFVDVVGVVDNT